MLSNSLPLFNTTIKNSSRNHPINHSPLPYTLTYVHYFLLCPSLSSNITLSLFPHNHPKTTLDMPLFPSSPNGKLGTAGRWIRT